MPYTDKNHILRLIENGTIRLHMSPLLTTDPSTSSVVNPDRLEGMLLGLAVGDALGNTSESMSYTERKAQFGLIRDYMTGLFFSHKPEGLPSDDTQMAFLTLQHILQNSCLDPQKLIEIFASNRISGIGMSVGRALARYRAGNKWYETGVDSAGNGALMRIAPVIIPYLQKPSADLWLDTIAAAVITHNDSTSTACCIAYIDLLWNILHGNTDNNPLKIVNRFCSIVSELEGDTVLKSRSGTVLYSGPLSTFLHTQISQALEENWSTIKVCTHWGSGAYLLETMPCLLYIICKHIDNFEEALVDAVNIPFDNDTIASLTGTILGAIHGKNAIPERWLINLPGKITNSTDATIYDLINQALMEYVS